MALTISRAFAEFDAKIRPTTAQVQTIAGRRESVRSYLTQSFGPSSSMPLLRTKVIGSASRNTIIRPIDDVDVMAVFDEPQVWGTYQRDSQAFIYPAGDGGVREPSPVRGSACRKSWPIWASSSPTSRLFVDDDHPGSLHVEEVLRVLDCRAHLG